MRSRSGTRSPRRSRSRSRSPLANAPRPNEIEDKRVDFEMQSDNHFGSRYEPARSNVLGIFGMDQIFDGIFCGVVFDWTFIGTFLVGIFW